MRIGVPRDGRRRDPRRHRARRGGKKLVKLGHTVSVQAAQATQANFFPTTPTAPPAPRSCPPPPTSAGADIVFKVRPPTPDEVALMRGAACSSASSGRRRTPS